MQTLYPTGEADSHASSPSATVHDTSKPPVELRLSKQERNRLAVARHVHKDPIAYRAKCREREQQRLAEDPTFRECKYQRKMVYAVIDSIKKGRRSMYRERFGYHTDALKLHLESQFEPGWDWDNHGTVWSVDHIRPVSAFVKDGVTEPSVISALSNLRPVAVFVNASKHAKDAPTDPTYSRPREAYTGVNHHLAKLTAQNVARIKSRLQSGEYGIVSKLAREYNVATNTITQIKAGITWRDVQPEE